jgi:hypothetical protein
MEFVNSCLLWSFGLCHYVFVLSLVASISSRRPRSEDGGDMLLRNVGKYLQGYLALQPRRPQSIFSLP